MHLHVYVNARLGEMFFALSGVPRARMENPPKSTCWGATNNGRGPCRAQCFGQALGQALGQSLGFELQDNTCANQPPLLLRLILVLQLRRALLPL